MDPATVAAAIALIAQIVKMIEDAKTASKEEHAAIQARLTAASSALASAADAAHTSLDADLAADAAALAAARKP